MLSSISAAVHDLIRKLGLREYSWLYLILIATANLYVAFHYRNDQEHFVFNSRFYARADFYDSGRRIIEEMQNRPLPNDVLYLRTLSYRNEDLYVFEIKAGLNDSSGAASLANTLYKRVLHDSVIRNSFTQRYEMMESDLAYLQAILDSTGKEELLYFQMKANQSQLYTDRDELLRRFNPLPLQTYQLSPHQPDHTRDHWIASFLAFSLAFLLRAFVLKRT